VSEELKPCPFCGDKPADTGTGFAVCRRHGWDSAIMEHDEWNTRPIEDAQAQRIARLERVLRAVDARLAETGNGEAFYFHNKDQVTYLLGVSQIRRVIAAAVGGES
jgi:Mor family transcriptional regulator